MAIENIIMPRLGESVVEGTVIQWLVGPGDTVERYQSLLEVETDKVVSEVTSSFSGTIVELLAQPQDVIQAGKPVCTIETSDAASSAAAAPSEEQKPAAKGPTAPSSASSAAGKGPAPQAPLADSAERGRSSPAVRRLAAEHNIELSAVTGSGLGGRITRKDIEKLIASGQVPQKGQTAPSTATQATASGPAVSAPASSATSPAQSYPGDLEIPVSPVRNAIASKMLQSKHEIPHAWMSIEVNASNLVALRSKIKDQFKEKEGFNLSYLPFFMKAVATALKSYPQLNSTWAGNKIIQRKDINLSVAMAQGENLFVPVIPHADEKSVKGLAKSLSELVAKVKGGKLTADDMQNGTFTVNNTGTFGSVLSMGIINHPQAAILQVESIVKRPVFQNGFFVPCDMVNLCISFDHRILDGLIAGHFMKYVKDFIEGINESYNIY